MLRNQSARQKGVQRKLGAVDNGFRNLVVRLVDGSLVRSKTGCDHGSCQEVTGISVLHTLPSLTGTSYLATEPPRPPDFSLLNL